MNYISFIIFGYLSGSIMFAYCLPKLFKGVDVRSLSDDGNPGTFNAFKYGGIPCGILVIVLELVKGMLPVYFAAKYVDTQCWAFALVMAAPVIGHAFPVYSHGKGGGKCIAVSFGVLLGLLPNMVPAMTLAFFYLLFSLVVIVKPDRVKTMVSFLCFLVTTMVLKGPKVVIGGCILISNIVIGRHMKNKPEEEKVQLYLAFHDKR